MPCHHSIRHNSDSSLQPCLWLYHYGFKGNYGPGGLRSRGSPIMSRLLYQAELRALKVAKPYWVLIVVAKNVMDITCSAGYAPLPHHTSLLIFKLFGGNLSAPVDATYGQP